MDARVSLAISRLLFHYRMFSNENQGEVPECHLFRLRTVSIQSPHSRIQPATWASGRRPFSEMFQNENDYLGKPEVEAICESIVGVAGAVREYLLDIDDIKLSPETYFFNTETGRFEFMYIPGRKREDGGAGDFRSGVRLVWERVLKKCGRDADRDFIMKLYDMYQKMSADNFNPESVFNIKEEKPEAFPEEVKAPVKIREVKEEDLYDEKEIEKIIEEDEKKVPDKKKKYAMYGGLAAAAIVTLAVMV